MLNLNVEEYIADTHGLDNKLSEIYTFVHELCADHNMKHAMILTLVPRLLHMHFNDYDHTYRLNEVIPGTDKLFEVVGIIKDKLHMYYNDPNMLLNIPDWLKPNPHYIYVVNTPGNKLYKTNNEFKSMLACNDLAHRINHYDMVCKTGLYINDKLGLKMNPNDIDAAAYLHDLFATYRDNHHELSYQYVRMNTNKLNKLLPNVWDWDDVSLACREHRASRVDVFTNTFTELMNAADRELPGDVAAMINRSANFGRMHKCQHSNTKRVIKHISDKYGANGYANYPALYLDALGDTLRWQQVLVDGIANSTDMSYFNSLGLDIDGNLISEGVIQCNPKYVKLLIEATQLQLDFVANK